ncbi:MAG: hypothetical protein AB7F43_11030 [Bacteriovoracia bacterium]
MKKITIYFWSLTTLLFAISSSLVLASIIDETYSRVAENPYTELPELAYAPSPCKLFVALARKNLRKTFQREGITIQDVKIAEKVIHHFGAVAQARFIRDNDARLINYRNAYGVLAQEHVDLIVRLSMAGAPKGGRLSPGIGLIFDAGLSQEPNEDGSPNIQEHVLGQVAMPALTGIDSKNVFVDDYRTWVKPVPFDWHHLGDSIKFQILVNAFHFAVRNPNILNVTHLIDGLGVKPTGLVFKPREEAAEAYALNENSDFRSALATLQPGLPLFDVYLVISPLELKHPELNGGTKIGTIVLTKPFVASEVGDSLRVEHFRESFSRPFPRAIFNQPQKPVE